MTHLPLVDSYYTRPSWQLAQSNSSAERSICQYSTDDVTGRQEKIAVDDDDDNNNKTKKKAKSVSTESSTTHKATQHRDDRHPRRRAILYYLDIVANQDTTHTAQHHTHASKACMHANTLGAVQHCLAPSQANLLDL